MSENPTAGPLKIGRYEILRELGRGAMGVVYEATDPALGRTIALKTIHPAIAGKLDLQVFETRFFTEARETARLQHPGIVIVHDVGRDSDSGTLFIALEHLKGRTLAELTDGGRALPWREAARVLASVARALHHAHLNGIVHRDMKPANVMVLDSGETKVMDFGIAKIEAGLHHLTTPGVPPEIDGIVARALAKDPQARFSDMQAMAEDLEAVLEGRTPLHLSGAGTAHPAKPGGSSVELMVAEDDPVEQAFHALVADAPPPPTRTELPRPKRAVTEPSPSSHRRLARRLLLVGIGVVGGAAVTYFFVGRPVDSALAPSAGAPPVTEVMPLPEASPPGTEGEGEVGKLAVDFEHSLRSGLLRIWLDEELVVEQRLAGQASKKGLVFTVLKGSYKDTLEVKPGRHTLRVKVAWEDNERNERIVGAFKPGVTRRLQVRLGRLRKSLSLEWE